METNPKKSKALIITIIILVIFLIVGFLLFKNRDKFSQTSFVNRIFSSVAPSVNTKTETAQAGEDIKKGDQLYTTSTNTNGQPIVMKYNGTGAVYGYANEDILNGNFGEITVYDPNANSNNFWESFYEFMTEIFNDPENNTPQPPGGWNNNGNGWVFDPNGIGGWVFDPNTNNWVPPGGIAPPPTGGWNNNGNGWVFDPNGIGGWVFDPNSFSWLPPNFGGGNGGENNFPTVIVTATPSTILSGESSTISWTSTNVTSCDAGVFGNGPNTTGSFSTGVLTENHSYTITCTGENGTKSDSASVMISNGNIENNLPVVTITATPPTINSGESSTISWTSINTNSCLSNGNEYETSGSYSTGPLSENKSYTVVCTGENGTDGDSVMVVLNDTECDNGATNYPICNNNKPDLRAGTISPIYIAKNTPTTMSSVISNYGGSTEKSFSSFFTITKTNPNPQGNGNNNNNISKLKNTINKIFNKISLISKALAEGGGNAIPDNSIDIVVTAPTIGANNNKIISISHIFTSLGIYYARVCADKNSPSDIGTIDESNENNNCGPWTTITVSDSLPMLDPAVCSDGKDNDGDGKIDIVDPNCYFGDGLKGIYMPNHFSESESPKPECSDNFDNDVDGDKDNNDLNCHVGGIITGEYKPLHNDESSNPPNVCSNGAVNPPACDIYEIIDPSEINSCKVIDKFPIEFTDEEKAQLAELLRKFYLLAPNLKTEEDIISAYMDKDEWSNLLAQVNGLKTQCMSQTYAQNEKLWGPERLKPDGSGNGWNVNGSEKYWPNETIYGTRYGNPWYGWKTENPAWAGSYLPSDYSPVDSYCQKSSNPPPGSVSILNCNNFNDRYRCIHADYNNQTGYTDCEWVDGGIDLRDYEILLNVW